MWLTDGSTGSQAREVYRFSASVGGSFDPRSSTMIHDDPRSSTVFQNQASFLAKRCRRFAHFDDWRLLSSIENVTENSPSENSRKRDFESFWAFG